MESRPGEIVYAVDSSTIDLCLSMFPWAKFKTTKSAIKLHTQIDLVGSIPVFISLTEGAMHDVHFIDRMFFEVGSIYVFDRGYLDFSRLHRIAEAGAFFVIRSKKNTKFSVRESRRVDKSTGLRCDQSIRLSSPKGMKSYPAKLRRIGYFDEETGKRLTFLTNNFTLPALKVASIYKTVGWYCLRILLGDELNETDMKKTPFSLGLFAISAASISPLSAAISLGDRILIDFGKNAMGFETPGNWNNVSNNEVRFNASTTVAMTGAGDLVRNGDGATTGVSFFFTNGSSNNALGIGGADNTDADNFSTFPESASRDTMFLSNGDTFAQFEIRGLDTSLTYNLRFFGSVPSGQQPTGYDFQRRYQWRRNFEFNRFLRSCGGSAKR